MKILAFTVLMGVLFGFAVCEDDQTMALKFLGQYGYMPSTLSGNVAMARAIRNFQEFYGLEMNGILDESTVNLMKKPRCGVPDASSGMRKKRYSVYVAWRINHLKYYVKPGLDLPHDQQKQIFAEAAKMWSDVSGLTLTEVSSVDNADIKISFGTGIHSGTRGEKTCAHGFDGPGGILGHAYQPEDGRIHFDEDETFTYNSKSGVNLLWVAVHEFGHVIGVDHTNVQGAIMHPLYLEKHTTNVKLHSDDIAAIQYLYGTASEGIPPTAPGSCKDASRPLCRAYADNGYCQEFPDLMKEMCPRACFNCNV